MLRKIEPSLQGLGRYPGFLIWIFLAYAWGLWRYAVPFTGDEKVYLSIAMEMRAHSDWLHPWLLGEHCYYKPPFEFWATLAGWKIFGFGLWGAFIPSVIATIITAACLGAIAKRVLSLSSGQVTSPLWFAAAAGTLTYGTTAQMEIWIVAFYSAAWLAALKYGDGGRRRWIFVALACAGVLSIVKSPLYSVLWVLGYWVYLALAKKTQAFKRASFWIAHFFGMVVGAAWFLIILATDKDKFLPDYLFRETLSKTGGNSSSALHMWGDFSTFCAPFLLTAALMIALGFQRRYRPFLLGWALVPAVFFTLFPYRTETYLFVLLPLIAIFMDLPARASRAFKLIARVNGFLVSAAVFAIAVIAYRAGMVSEITSAALIVLGLVNLVFCWHASRDWKTLAALSLTITFMVRMGAIELGTNDLRPFLTESAQSPSLVFYDPDGYIWHEVGLLSVAAGRPGVRARTLTEFGEALQRGALGILSDGDWPAALPLLHAHGHVLATSWWRWKRSFQGGEFSGHREYKLVREMAISALPNQEDLKDHSVRSR